MGAGKKVFFLLLSKLTTLYEVVNNIPFFCFCVSVCDKEAEF